LYSPAGSSASRNCAAHAPQPGQTRSCQKLNAATIRVFAQNLEEWVLFVDA
jgi:hypothetical protein